MKRNSLYLLLFFCGLFTCQTGNSQNFAELKNNILHLNNGVISRKINFNKNNTGILTTSFQEIKTGEEFNFPEVEEFYFEINGKTLTGKNKWEFVKSEVISINGGKGICVYFINSENSIEIGINYLLFPELPIIRKNIKFKNIGATVQKIESLDVERLRFKNSGAGTNCWVMNDFGRFKSLSQFTGDWYDPVVVVHQVNKNRGVFLGNEAPGVMKRTTAFLEPDLLTAGLTHKNQNFGFAKYLKPGESWESTWVFSGVYSNSNNPNEILNTAVSDLVRRHLDFQIFKVKKMPTFVYNTWDPFRHDINEKMIFELADAAAECGIEEFIIDDGWQDSYGDWGIHKEKFPNGLKPVFDYIKSKGMKPGVWISVAAAEAISNVYKEHPEWLVRKADGSPINLHADHDKMYNWESYSMCMTTGWKNYIKNVILEMVEEHGLEYIKADFAVATGAYTTIKTRSGCHATNHLHTNRSESLLEMYQATWDLFDELHKEAPQLFIDCTFETMGDLHLIDFDMCKHADGNWMSNYREPAPLGALRVRQLAWWRTPTIPAASMVIGNQRLDDPNFLFSLKSLAGTLPIVLGDPRILSQKQRKEIKAFADWLKVMQNKHQFMSFRQDLPGFGEPTEGSWDGFQRINTETKSGGILGVFKQNAKDRERWITINYLDPEAEYQILLAPTNKVVFTGTGTELHEHGFKIELTNDFQGELFEISRIE